MDERHNAEFTVIGNHLAQHPDLSLTAIGVATYIQSVPNGTPVGVKALAARFTEGRTRIAAALRELEEHGYLTRTKERLPSGQIVTRTTSYNVPRTCSSRTASQHTADVLDLPVHRAAHDVLAGLRTHDPQLHLAERDMRRLAPAVATWLERIEAGL